MASEPGASSAEVMPSAGLRDIRTTDLLRRAQPAIATKPNAIGMYLPGSSAPLKLPLYEPAVSSSVSMLPLDSRTVSRSGRLLMTVA